MTISERSGVDTPLPRVEIRGTERFMSMSPTTCFKIVHVMLLEGPPTSVDAFMSHAAEALMHTFNRHPRMRLRVVEDEFAVAEIHPKLTLQDVVDQKLLQVKALSSSDETSDTAWEAFVQRQVDIPFDRVNGFSFELHAWIDGASGTVRLLLFADHFTSDGMSGTTILNDVLSIASALARDDPDLSRLKEELPLRGSIYQQTFGSRPFLRSLLSSVLYFVAKTLFKSAPPFVPLIKPRAEHRSFTVPPPTNLSTLLFATGSDDNLEKLLLRCREEKTTFFGALSAAIVLGLALVTDVPRDQKLQLVMNFALNMRSRLPEPVEPETVGVYALGGEVHKLTAGGGVDLAAVGFWEAARSIKQEAEEAATSFAVTSLPVMMLDQSFHSQTLAADVEGTSIAQYACAADVNISSVGQYAYPTTHSFQADHAREGLSVKSLHINCRTPFVAPLIQFYITSVASGGIGYGLSHHLEPAVGERVLDAVVKTMEQAWRIASGESLLQAMGTLHKP